MRIAVVGGGISGMLVARMLADDHEVQLFEAEGYVGGHTHTVDVKVDGETYAADTGFMVFNDRTYPNFIRMLDLLGVPSRASDMSFRVCCNLLKPKGMMLLQAITIADQSYEAYRRSVDFIQRYVFPGGLLPSVEAMCRSVTRATDFRLFHLEDITPHYAQTLAHWRQRFYTNLAEIRQLGLPDELLRVWEFYFCYCEGAFRERVIGDVQMLLTRPRCRRDSILPPLAI